jgi:hypothetical protein
MTRLELIAAIGKEFIRHEAMRDVAFLPGRVVDETEVDINVHGRWFNTSMGCMLNAVETIPINKKNLPFWHVYSFEEKRNV